ncbi:MAG: Signal transduction histidine-protein kinase BaeS [Stenotrophomonas maltophilia]|nr:MAG: Signal transduction histidine-protein kinase BaeS [Stenotrophomonas maltophilia]
MLRPLAMHRLFSNLVDNAVMYGQHVRVRASRRDGATVVVVSDNGPGLDPDQLEAVFDPFVRLETSRSRQTGGAGLVLTIARALAEKDGARLWLRNRPEGGLEAVVEWPAGSPAVPPPRPSATA